MNTRKLIISLIILGVILVIVFVLIMKFFNSDHYLAFGFSSLIASIILYAFDLSQLLYLADLNTLWQRESTVKRKINIGSATYKAPFLLITINRLLDDSNVETCAKIKIAIKETEEFLASIQNSLLQNIFIHLSLIVFLLLLHAYLSEEAQPLDPIRFFLSYFAIIVQALWRIRIFFFFREYNKKLLK